MTEVAHLEKPISPSPMNKAEQTYGDNSNRESIPRVLARNSSLTLERVNNIILIATVAPSTTVSSARSQDTPSAGTSLNPVVSVKLNLMLLSISFARLIGKCTKI